MGYSKKYVRDCDLIPYVDVDGSQQGCKLWPFRFGRKPREEDLMVAQITTLGETSGYRHYKEELQARKGLGVNWRQPLQKEKNEWGREE